MVHETRARAHAAAKEEGKVASKKQKTESKDQERGQHVTSKNKKSTENKGQDAESEAPTKSKKLKAEESEPNGKGAEAGEFADFCKAIGEHLSVEDMRKILQANEQDASGSEDAVVPRCEDMMFYGPLEKCPICRGQLEFKEWKYKCTGNYSEWARCTFSTNNPSRRNGPIKIPDDIKDDFIHKWLKQHEGKEFPKRDVDEEAHIFSGMMIALSGRMSRSHGYFKEQIMKHGGKVNNSVLGVTCVVASPAERDKGGSGGFAEALLNFMAREQCTRTLNLRKMGGVSSRRMA